MKEKIRTKPQNFAIRPVIKGSIPLFLNAPRQGRRGVSGPRTARLKKQRDTPIDNRVFQDRLFMNLSLAVPIDGIPACAGMTTIASGSGLGLAWIPACAGMTEGRIVNPGNRKF